VAARTGSPGIGVKASALQSKERLARSLRLPDRQRIAMSRVLIIGACSIGIGIFRLAAVPLAQPYTVENYDVAIRANFASQRLDGQATLRIHSRVEMAITALELDAGTLQITSVEEGPDRQFFERKGGSLFVALTNPLRPDEYRTLTLRYQAGPSPGLKFFSDQVYGAVTSDWMPCNDRPDERATLHLTIAAPPNSTAAASGQLTASRTDNGESITEWQLNSAVAPSRFGFAIGSFAENTSEADGVKLRVLGGNKDVLESTAAAMRFLAERSGKGYPGKDYTQVFVHGETRHAAAGLALLAESSAAAGGNRPDLQQLVANELAQQWYGVEIASKDWSDLWLNEGLSAFLANEFLAQRLGKESSEPQIKQSWQNYNVLRAEGKDRPLSDSDWTTRQDRDEKTVVQKGVCFLYSLNELVGDSAFSSGLRLYTDGKWGHAAGSEDFQDAFRAVYKSDRNEPKKRIRRKGDTNPPETPLDKLFDLWVYGVATANSR
jgi:aminopeptidase N